MHALSKQVFHAADKVTTRIVFDLGATVPSRTELDSVQQASTRCALLDPFFLVKLPPRFKIIPNSPLCIRLSIQPQCTIIFIHFFGYQILRLSAMHWTYTTEKCPIKEECLGPKAFADAAKAHMVGKLAGAPNVGESFCQACCRLSTELCRVLPV